MTQVLRNLETFPSSGLFCNARSTPLRPRSCSGLRGENGSSCPVRQIHAKPLQSRHQGSVVSDNCAENPVLEQRLDQYRCHLFDVFKNKKGLNLRELEGVLVKEGSGHFFCSAQGRP